MKGLDWSNESYVRLYRTDTPAFRRLRTEAQGIYVLILRKLDRAGTMQLDGLFPHEAVAEMIGADEGAVEKALERIMAAGLLEVNTEVDMLVDPEFLDREETTRTDMQRKRDSRAARRDLAKVGRSVMAHPSRYGTDVSHIVTDRSQPVTARHSSSQLVTPSVPSVPSFPPNEERIPTGSLVGDPDGSHDAAPDNGDLQLLTPETVQGLLEGTQTSRTRKSLARETGQAGEMKWRVLRCWEVYLGMRDFHWEDREGTSKAPGPPPILTTARRKLIREAMLRHKEAAMDREEWEKRSRTRGAGAGIWLDKWSTGEAEGNRIGEGGRRYTEPERCWGFLKQKDQVDRFSELYFETKQREAEREKDNET